MSTFLGEWTYDFIITSVILVEFGTCKQWYANHYVISGIFACWVRLDYYNAWIVFWLPTHIENCISSLFFPDTECWSHILFVLALQALPVWWAGMCGVKMYLAQVQTLNRMRPMWCEFISWQCLLAIKLDSDDHTDVDSELVHPQEVDPSKGEMQQCQRIPQMESLQ